MAKTIVAQEMFTGIGTINSGSTGAFSGVYGLINKWQVGPSLTTNSNPGTGNHGDMEAIRTIPGFAQPGTPTISFTASTKTITDTQNNFIRAGFRAGDAVLITNSVSNNGDFTISAVTAGTLVVNETLVNESAGSQVVIVTIYGAYFNLSGASTTGSNFEFWYWTGDGDGNGNSSIAQAGVNFGGTAPWLNIYWQLIRTQSQDYNFAHAGESSVTVSQSLIPQHTWVRFYAYEFYTGSSFLWTYRMGYQLVGGPEVDVFNRVNFLLNNVSFYNVVGINNDQSNVTYSRAYAAVTLTQITSPADFSPASNVVQPVNVGHNWYVSAVSSTPGDGLTPATALTTSQMGTALIGSGVLGNTNTANAANFDNLGNPVGYGDKIIMLNDGQYPSFNLLPNVIQRGCWITTQNKTQVIINSYKNIATTGWTQPNVTTFPNVWSIQDTEPSPVVKNSPVVFEIQVNGARWGMNPQVGTSFASVATAINTTPGSYWSDLNSLPGTLYISTFGGGNPNSDGKTRIRSTFNAQECSIGMGGQDNLIENITGYGPANYDWSGISTPAGLVNAGGLGIEDGGGRIGGTVRSCDFLWWGKHAFNFTSECTNCNLLIQNCQAEMGWPFAGGSQSALVNTKDVPTTETIYYYKMLSRGTQNGWATGASGAVAAASQDIWLTHGGGNYNKITFDTNVLEGGHIDAQGTLGPQEIDIICMNSSTYSLINPNAGTTVKLLPCSSSFMASNVSNASRDQNGVPALICASESDGQTVIPIQANPTLHAVIVQDGTSGVDAGNNGGSAMRDQNGVPVLLALSSAGDGSIVEVYGEPITGSILIDSI